MKWPRQGGKYIEANDHVLVATADPTRRAILGRLRRGPARITDIAAPFEMSLAAVSKHVRMLERGGLVRRARQGREHTLTLDARPLRRVTQWTSRYAPSRQRA